MTIQSISQNTVTRLRGRGIVGQRVFENRLDAIRSVLNKTPQAFQVGTITVDTATDSATYTCVINGVTVSFVNGTSSSTTTTAVLLAAAINASPLVRGAVVATAAVAIVTLTAIQPGIAFTASDSDAKLTTVEAATAAASADAIPFGRAVMRTAFDTAQGGYEMLGGLVKTGNLTAQVDTITVDYAASEIYLINITVRGIRYLFEIAADTDDATTATAIRAAINAELPADTVVCTGATDQVILTAEVAGQAFVTSVGLKSGTIARLALVHTTATEVTDLTKVLVGGAMMAYDEEIPLGDSDASYPANAGCRVLSAGAMFVESTGTAAMVDPVYIETASGASSGKFYTSASSTRVYIPPAIAAWSEPGGITGDTGVTLNAIKFNCAA